MPAADVTIASMNMAERAFAERDAAVAQVEEMREALRDMVALIQDAQVIKGQVIMPAGEIAAWSIRYAAALHSNPSDAGGGGNR